ncbi:MAG: preprotein translocase subunit SecA [Clostridiales bacterium]|nr:preprotein translocase subunit SecA [Clostridiales bacterium]
MSLIEKIFGTHSDHELKRIYPIVDKIEAMEPEMEKLSDEELAAQTAKFKQLLSEGKTLDDILVDAYATVREAAKRVLGQRAYRVQLVGGIILHQGRIPEMRTGEGKTLVSTFPVYLNALSGKGVHVVTVNDYLAQRDSDWMGQVHRFLGLTVGTILGGMESDERREAYKCDITYGTNNEFGFDYLRDNMVIYKEKLVQRGLNYAVIDEVDSVLIDEARTPLIISGQSGKSTKLYEVCDIIARQLKRGTVTEVSQMDMLLGQDVVETGDYVVHEKEKQVNLTESGIKKVEEFFKIENLADPENQDIQHHIDLALRAHSIMHRDQDYVVDGDEVVIVDDFTGRIMPGRRFSDGLHQAIEAKERVKVKRENRTLATITFQNFFNKYTKKCGMTGTALTEEAEFREIYGMDVICVPTNKPVQRVDLEDAVYTTKREKLNAIVQQVKMAYEKKQPVLVGTVTIDSSEEISKLLTKAGIPHQVLNAKFHEKEAEIVALAGQAGMVTIATNMAGRGTDIKLGEGVKELGGLKIIGTERHESRRIDNQLRGRAGRQGDVGESRFYISLEDDLMRLFGSEKMIKVFKTLGIQEGQEIEHKMLSSVIEKAQKKIEENNFGIRRNVMEYDIVNNEQREIIYAERRRVLDGENMREPVLNMVKNTAAAIVDTYIGDDQYPDEWELSGFNDKIEDVFAFEHVSFSKEELEHVTKKSFKKDFVDRAVRKYEEQEAQFEDTAQFREVERVLLLKCIDRRWMNHIDDMEQLKQGIHLVSYGQKKPTEEYKITGFEMFQEMTDGIAEDTVKAIMHIRVEQKVEREEVAKVTGTNKDDTAVPKTVKRSGRKIMPNDPCPCGSGKKYKFCHMKIENQ